ncbi:hypothetical protein [Bradyrhizobium macuxiense]|uniref:hypothetical protein n=1 Tax=Bradyrhizobium macuxiense TaxID=1755647 RepID=UPI0010A953F8|nr:hypothetical protein [Bradyrhizobium macuxiense]
MTAIAGGLVPRPPRKRAGWCFFERRAHALVVRIDRAVVIAPAAADAVLHKRWSAWLKIRPAAFTACRRVCLMRPKTY